jgi:hypothetical protein
MAEASATRLLFIPDLPGILSAEQASLLPSGVRSPAQSRLLRRRLVRAAGAVTVAQEEVEGAEEEVGGKAEFPKRNFYLDPTRCTLNLSPRGQVALFFFLQ